jgi:tocopherol O-methyltransferase
MIASSSPVSTADVARHYDDLDAFYREVWGEHVHHGLFRDGARSPEDSTRALIELVARRARIGAGTRVCDVGCGYGGTARALARERGAVVTGVTLSRAQREVALQMGGRSGDPDIVLGDFLAQRFEPGSFDVVISIESSEHFADKPALFAEARRLLAPGGRLAVCAWLACEAPRPWEERHLLEPICREGRLPGLGTEQDYVRFLREAGFRAPDVEDLTGDVQDTWAICLARLGAGLVTRRDFRAALMDRGLQDRVFLLTMMRILAAYRLRAMRYALLVTSLPGGEEPRRGVVLQQGRAVQAPLDHLQVARLQPQRSPGGGDAGEHAVLIEAGRLPPRRLVEADEHLVPEGEIEGSLAGEAEVRAGEDPRSVTGPRDVGAEALLQARTHLVAEDPDPTGGDSLLPYPVLVDRLRLVGERGHPGVARPRAEERVEAVPQRGPGDGGRPPLAGAGVQVEPAADAARRQVVAGDPRGEYRGGPELGLGAGLCVRALAGRERDAESEHAGEPARRPHRPMER